MGDSSRSQGLQWQAKQDWVALREEFFETRNADGTYAYKYVKDFARAKWAPETIRSKNGYNIAGQNMPVMWFCKSVGSKENPPMKWYGDWEADRIIGEERFSKYTRELKDKIQQEVDLLEAGRVLANSYLPLQEKVFDVLRATENHLCGTILLNNTSKSKKDQLKTEHINAARLKMYTNVLNWVVNIKSRIDTQFLKMLGWDRPQFLAYFEQLRLEARKGDQTQTVDGTVNRILAQLAVDQIEKSRMYELPLPEDVQVASEKIRRTREPNGRTSTPS